VAIVDSKVGKAARFDGTGWVAVKGTFPSGNSPRTMAVWLKSDSGPTDKFCHVLSYGRLKPTDLFGIGHVKHWQFYNWGKGDFGLNVEVDKEWHHHCITYDGEEVVYYFDGERGAARRVELATGGDRLLLGSYAPFATKEAIPKGPGYSHLFRGQMAGLLIYDRALNPRQVRWLFKKR
jgi:hypothetical protein